MCRTYQKVFESISSKGAPNYILFCQHEGKDQSHKGGKVNIVRGIIKIKNKRVYAHLSSINSFNEMEATVDNREFFIVNTTIMLLVP